MIDIFSHRKSIFTALFFGYTALLIALCEIPQHGLHVYFLDVGQGDSIFINTPQNHQILVDGGPKTEVLNELSDVMPFFDKSIDLVVLTHPHDDHIQGLVEVLKKYEVDAVLITGVSFNNSNYNEFLRVVNEKNIPVRFAKSSEDFSFGEVFLDIIYPFKSLSGKTFSNINNSSIAMKVIYKDHSIYLGGDGEIEVEKEILASGFSLKSDVYKASHHGSRTASSLDFLVKIRPKIAVIQVGKDNTFKHPHPETLRSLFKSGVEKIYRNDLDGRVEFVF